MSKSANRGIPVFVEVVYSRDAPISTFTKSTNMALDYLDLHVSFVSYHGRVLSIPVGVIAVCVCIHLIQPKHNPNINSQKTPKTTKYIWSFLEFFSFLAVPIGIMFWLYCVSYLPSLLGLSTWVT